MDTRVPAPNAATVACPELARASRRRALGVVLAVLTLTAAGVLLLRASRSGSESAGGEALPVGTSTAWVWHYSPALQGPWRTLFPTLLDAAPPDVRLYIAAQDEADILACRDHLGTARADDPRITWLRTGRSMSAWARDRYVAFERGERPTVWTRTAAQISAAEQGDVRVPHLIAQAVPALEVKVAPHQMEGGNIIVRGRRVFVGYPVLAQNTSGTESERRSFVRTLSNLFDREVFVVGCGDYALPCPHLDIVLMPLDDTEVVLGDPRLALDVFGDGEDAARDRLRVEGLPVFQRATQLRHALTYDRIARDLRKRGLKVHRIPIVHGDPQGHGGPDVILTWCNVLLHESDGSRFAFVPTYGMAHLDQEAEAVWRRLGYAVHPIPVAEAIWMGGALRCLTQVIPGIPIPPAAEDAAPGSAAHP